MNKYVFLLSNLNDTDLPLFGDLERVVEGGSAHGHTWENLNFVRLHDGRLRIMFDNEIMVIDAPNT